MISFVQNQRMERARKAENEALAAAGAESYLGFHLQRVNGLLDSEQARKRLMEADHEYEAAMQAWMRLAGDIVPDWANEHRAEIEATADQLQNMTTFGSGPMVDTDDDQIAALAHALMQRLTKVRDIGPAGESLPLVLDDALVGLDSDMKASLLELLVHSSDDQQIVFLTQDSQVTEWARVEAITGELAILEPGGAPEDSTVDVTDAAVNVA